MERRMIDLAVEQVLEAVGDEAARERPRRPSRPKREQRKTTPEQRRARRTQRPGKKERALRRKR
jgi:hypothetical protein